MPVWSVHEPYISVWLQDEPSAYRTSLGNDFVLKLFYHQRETRPVDQSIFSFGPFWNCNWLSYLTVTNISTNSQFADYNAALYGAGGGELPYYTTNDVPEYSTRTTLRRILSGTDLTGFVHAYPDGSQAIYGLLLSVSQAPEVLHAFLTARVDPQGRAFQQFAYNC